MPSNNCVLVTWWRTEYTSTHYLRRKQMNIYVGQLPYNTTEEELKAMFTEFGEVASLSLITDKFSGQSKGFGFVEMPNNSEADQAIKGLNKTMLKGREIKVNQAEERKKSTFRKRRF
jgi:RNA recognition motif-containing protein